MLNKSMSDCPVVSKELREQLTEPFFEREKGILIVISGPSCAGKGSVCKIICRKNPDLRLSISETTRQPRNYEKHGREYFYISKKT